MTGRGGDGVRGRRGDTVTRRIVHPVSPSPFLRLTLLVFLIITAGCKSVIERQDVRPRILRDVPARNALSATLGTMVEGDILDGETVLALLREHRAIN